MKHLNDDRLRTMREDARKATKGRWGAWGMSLLCGVSGMNADTAEHLADVYTKDEHGRPRTFDLDHIVNFQPEEAMALVDEVLHLRAVVRRAADPTVDYAVRQRLLRDAAMGTPIVWGEPTQRVPANALRGALPDEDPAREAQWQANRSGERVAYQNDEGAWVEAEPLGMIGWKAKAEERFREYGWTRLANLMARWDERGLGA